MSGNKAMMANNKTNKDEIVENLAILGKTIWYYKYIYLLLLPGIIYYIVFKYIPIYGIQLAFKDFVISKGITGSPWVGLENFKYLVGEPEFWNAFKNTLILAFLRIILAFPIPIVLAILINELRFKKCKRVLQTIYTFPHFLSWVVLSGMIINLLGSSGAINSLFVLLGFNKVDFLLNKGSFRYLLIYTNLWKEAGWGTIIYLATITGIDPSLYEAAEIDGANRWQKIKNITWAGIRTVVITMLVLRIGHSLEQGFMQVLNLYNPVVYEVSDIIDTYIYRITFERAPNFGFSTAVGLFKGITNCILLLSANKIAKWFGESGVI